MADVPQPAPSASELTPDARTLHAGLKAVLGQVARRPTDLAAILDASIEALIGFDGARRILHANHAAEDFFGYPIGSLNGVSTDMLIPERLRQPQTPDMVPLVEVMEISLPGRLRDGTELTVDWALASVAAPGGPIFVMTVRDRAATDRMIDRLRASEERFRLLVEGVQDYAIFMLDQTGHVSSWNAGAERIAGWSVAEILGRSYDTFFTDEDRAAGVPGELLAAASREGSQDVIGWRMRKDGTRFRAGAYVTALRSSTGELRGFAKITRDLTEKLQAEDLERRLTAERVRREAAEAAEKRVRASEERLRRLRRITAALAEAITPLDVASVVLNLCLQELDADGGALYVLSPDAQTLELLEQRGHSRESIGGFERLALDARTPLADATRERAAGFYENLQSIATRYPHLEEPIRADGFEASVALPLVTHGLAVGALGIRFREPRMFDPNDRSMLLTLGELCSQALDRARLFMAEHKARAEAESASRAKDEFLAILGHELRNPLAPIVTALRLMKMRDGNAFSSERAVIERQITHLMRLVDDLLDVSRITQGKVELKKAPIELLVAVNMAVELSSPVLEERRHHLSVSVPAEGLMVHGDVTRLSQVITNLLTNAAKYTPPGGHIDVIASRDGERIQLAVRDDGTGIAAETLPRVFDLFTQERQSIDRSQGGLGLGLAIVRSLVAMHNGAVEVSSQGQDCGSVFTVVLPAASPAEAASLAPTTPTAAHVRGARRRVLVVDDNDDAAELLAELITMSGHAAVIAHDGPRALDLAATFHPEIALLDIGLPVMDGYELARRLRAQSATVRLIAVTGYAQESARERARAAGFDMHLVKPVEIEALRAALGMS